MSTTEATRDLDLDGRVPAQLQDRLRRMNDTLTALDQEITPIAESARELLDEYAALDTVTYDPPGDPGMWDYELAEAAGFDELCNRLACLAHRLTAASPHDCDNDTVREHATELQLNGFPYDNLPAPEPSGVSDDDRRIVDKLVRLAEVNPVAARTAGLAITGMADGWLDPDEVGDAAQDPDTFPAWVRLRERLAEEGAGR